MARADRGCVNPECQGGVTPGLILIGGGKNAAPLIQNGQMRQQAMRYGWVTCRACNPDEKAPFVKKNWTPEEIQERARLADSKAPYVPKETDQRLAKVKASAQSPHVPAPSPDTRALQQALEQNAKLMEQNAKMMEQISGLTEQVTKLSGQLTDLVTENARLRTAPQELQTALSPPSGSGGTPKKRKSRQIAKPTGAV